MQVAQVQSSVRELRFHMLNALAKNKQDMSYCYSLGNIMMLIFLSHSMLWHYYNYYLIASI